jgi:hypothetical protein
MASIILLSVAVSFTLMLVVTPFVVAQQVAQTIKK